jgi:hypothetical protein
MNLILSYEKTLAGALALAAAFFDKHLKHKPAPPGATLTESTYSEAKTK